MKTKAKAEEPKTRVYDHSSGVRLIAFREFPDNPRFITPGEALKLAETMGQFGSLDGIVVNIAPGLYQGAVVSGNQKTRHIGVEELQPVVTKRFKQPTEAGTVAYGYVEFKSERFPYREVYWSDNKCEVANIVANNAGGHNDPNLLANFSEEIRLSGGINLSLEQARYRLLQNFLEIDAGIGYDGLPDYSKKNKEIEVGEMGDRMKITLTFKSEDYDFVVGALSEMADTPEQSVLKLIGYE